MYNLWKCEVMKLKKSFPLKILTLLMFMFSIVSSFSSLSYIHSPYLIELEIPLSGYDAFFSSLHDMPTLVMLGIIIITFVVSSDFENRMIQAEIAAGHSRFAILCSKLLAFSLTYLIVYLPYPVGRAIFQGIFYEFGLPLTLGVVSHMIAALGAVLLSAIAVNGIVFLLSFVVRKSILVAGISFVGIVLGGSAFMSLTLSIPVLSELVGNVPIGFFKALSVSGYSSFMIIKASLISLISIILILFITYVLFRRAELK